MAGPPAALALDAVLCRHPGPEGGGGFEILVERLQVHRGEALALAGPSGAGKSTLLNLLALALRPASADRFALNTRGGATIDLAALWRRREEERLTATRAAHMGYVLQRGGLLPWLSVRRNIALSQAVLGRRDSARVVAVAERLEIAALLDRMPATLSVGQRQRVAIARALAHRPEVVLADEPTASVHPALADAVLALLIEQAREEDAALVLATHDPDRAARHGFTIVKVEPAGPGRSRLLRAAAATA
ncbi:MAG TPA: ATP-binding cassette domain-containing protein [Crenalkalicoccus sp.]|nr:ATP-binding cassette domain-containing protein [Crenalkalicoccus sp.]